mmetsp:Transcript_125512/g.360829  ORF Transcript_125512/g.360829 Transcript_125512/m.360829 type:complete len:151 (-) Transcript_125512:231-683(-)
MLAFVAAAFSLVPLAALAQPPSPAPPMAPPPPVPLAIQPLEQDSAALRGAVGTVVEEVADLPDFGLDQAHIVRAVGTLGAEPAEAIEDRLTADEEADRDTDELDEEQLEDGNAAPARRLGCLAVGSICWVNAQCCGGRCIRTNRCGPRVR